MENNAAPIVRQIASNQKLASANAKTNLLAVNAAFIASVRQNVLVNSKGVVLAALTVGAEKIVSALMESSVVMAVLRIVRRRRLVSASVRRIVLVASLLNWID